MVKKQIRGLLDYTSVNNDEDWEFAPLSEEYMIGMGLGASREATRWAFKGYLLELHQTWTSYKKKVGRKKKSEYGSIDCQRAMLIWVYLPIVAITDASIKQGVASEYGLRHPFLNR